MQLKTLHYHKNYQYNATCKSKHYTTIKTTNIMQHANQNITTYTLQNKTTNIMQHANQNITLL